MVKRKDDKLQDSQNKSILPPQLPDGSITNKSTGDAKRDGNTTQLRESDSSHFDLHPEQPTIPPSSEPEDEINRGVTL